MKKRTRALDISKEVKDAVWERDGARCILCGSPYAKPNAHFINRAQGGLGIAQNVVTLCIGCHEAYDHTTKRRELRDQIRDYLKREYSHWDEIGLTYRKGQD